MLADTKFWLDVQLLCQFLFILGTFLCLVLLAIVLLRLLVQRFQQQAEPNRFRIRSTTERDDDTGELLYWNNRLGWVDRQNADIFTAADCIYGLPAESRIESIN